MSVHPLLKGIYMLKQHSTSSARRRTAIGVAASATLLFAGLGQALQSSPPSAVPHAAPGVNIAQSTPTPAADINTVMVTMELEVDGKTVAKPRLFGALGKTMVVRWQADGAPAGGAWEIEVTPTAASTPGQLMFSGKLSTGEPLRVVSQPRLVTGEGQTASVQMAADAGRPSLKLTLKGQRMAQPERADLPTSKLTSLALPAALR
jgi:hypothetical protein